MPDFTDRVQDATELFNSLALADATRGSAPKPSRQDCLDCEEPIPEARREAQPGCERCLACQTDLENITDNWRPL